MADKAREGCKKATADLDMQKQSIAADECQRQSLEKMLETLKKVKGHITIAPRTWMRKDMKAIAGSEFKSVPFELLLGKLGVPIPERDSWLSSFGEQYKIINMLATVQ
jgi:hypothetical protein